MQHILHLDYVDYGHGLSHPSYYKYTFALPPQITQYAPLYDSMHRISQNICMAILHHDADVTAMCEGRSQSFFILF